MEKYSLFGELLYIGFVCEKGRCKSSGLWKWGYKRILYKHIVMLKQIIQCILLEGITDQDVSVIKKFIELAQTERDIGKYYPISEHMINLLQECNYSIINSVDPKKCNNNINHLMDEITSEILKLLDKGIIVNKKKLSMLIRAVHNLPRVYLGNDKQTLCSLEQPAIDFRDAIEYSFSNMDKDTKQKYGQYYQC